MENNTDLFFSADFIREILQILAVTQTKAVTLTFSNIAGVPVQSYEVTKTSITKTFGGSLV